MRVLPVLLSIPHGGTHIPEELKKLICIERKDVFYDSDPYSKELYDLGRDVKKVIFFPIARAFIDVNRHNTHLPPAFPDGVIKSHTCHQIKIYRNPPENRCVERVIKRYYETFHNKIRNAVKDKEITLCLDCHTMLAYSPAISPVPGEKRPLLCLGNCDGRSCSFEKVEKLANCFKEVFSLGKNDISINEPFRGGYISRTYGQNPLPWIQVELNRDLYLNSEWFKENTMRINPQILDRIRSLFKKVLIKYFEK
ncbi:N-formylglutamate amidohydrolase [Candidatus Riflebacteria bacterium]